MERPSALESNYFLPNFKITALINKLMTMSKNPSIESDLSQVLDEFLGKLSECDKYLENGIFNMNFAEAALLIQSSADIYSKKVDLLWDIIFDYQKRILLSEEQNVDKEQEIEKLEERKRKYKRKRKTNSDETQTAKLVNNFSFGQVENCDYLGQSYEVTDLSKEWEKFYVKDSSDSLELSSNKTSLFLPNNSVYTKDRDYIGRYDQFHSASLIDDIFHLEEQKVLADDYNCVTQMRIDSYIVNDFLLDRSIPSDKPQDSYSSELNEHVNNFLQSHKLPDKDAHLPYYAMQQLYCKKSYVCLERLPFSVMREKLRRTSLADSLFDDDQMSSISEECPSPSNLLDNDTENCVALENRSKSCSQDSAFYEDVEDSINHEDDTHVAEDTTGPESAATDTETARKLSNVSDVAAETAGKASNVSDVASETARKASNVSDVAAINSTGLVDETSRKSNVETEEKSAKVEEQCVSSSSIVTRAKVPRKWALVLNDTVDKEEKTKKRKVTKQVSAKVLQKLATGVTVPYRDFEKFCRSQYQPGKDEGIPPVMSDSEDSEDDSNEKSDEDEDEEDEDVTPPVIEDEDEEEEEETHAEVVEELEISKISEVSHSTLSSNAPGCSRSLSSNAPGRSRSVDMDVFERTLTDDSEIPVSEADLEQEEVLRRNVREWRSFIIPKLKSLENKADFDIHDYGSRIIEPSQVGESLYFNDIVKDKNPAEVARYFIATLQLANTYNVEITGAVPGEVANKSFQVKILDKTRHHELLEEYQAPSEETFRERLERARSLNPGIHSTPISEPPIKKIRISSSRKLF